MTAMADIQQSKPLIIGIGNCDRGDDQVGIRVAEKIQRRLGDGVDVIFHRSDPAYLLEHWQGRERVIGIDAVVSENVPPGEIVRWDAAGENLPAAGFHASTHSLGIHQAIALSRALNKMPRRLYLYGINAASFTAGQGMSAAVERAAETVVEEIIALAIEGAAM